MRNRFNDYGYDGHEPVHLLYEDELFIDDDDDYDPIFDQDGVGVEEMYSLTHDKIYAKLEVNKD